MRALKDGGVEVLGVRLGRPSLEDVFVQVTGLAAEALKREKEKAMEGGIAMRTAVAFWNILLKDMRTYYLKPPNISWGIIFPLAWTTMFFIKTGESLHHIRQILPGIVAVSILFGTTSMPAVTVTFEKKNRSFERLLLAPISLMHLMLAKTSGAILFGVAKAFVPVILAAFVTDLTLVSWWFFGAAVVLIAVASTFLGLFIAVLSGTSLNLRPFPTSFGFP